MPLVSKNAAPAEKSIIIDSPKVFATFLAICLFTCLALYYCGKDWNFFILWGIIDIIIIWRFFIIAKGYVIDVNKNMLIFPGGGIEANSWTSYFNPLFLLQRFRRYKIMLSQIRSVSAYIDTNTYVDTNGQPHTSKNNMLEITGDFGAADFNFWSKGKRDQLYAALINLNEMGIPVSNRQA